MVHYPIDRMELESGYAPLQPSRDKVYETSHTPWPIPELSMKPRASRRYINWVGT